MDKVKIKKIVVGALALVAVVVVIFAISQSSFGGSNEAKLTKKLETVGADFYENFYVEQISQNKTEEEVKTFLGRYTEIGIKVDIENLSRYDEVKYPNLIEEFVNKKGDIKCDARNTKAIIYPKEPFTNKDYTISSELDCGFPEE